MIGESNSIVRYVANTRNIDNHYYPKDAKKRALIDNFLDWHLGNSRIKLVTLVRAKIAPMVGNPLPPNI
jgi:hypothetical protein